MNKETKEQMGRLLVKTVREALRVDRSLRDVPILGKMMAETAIAAHLIVAANQINKIEEKSEVKVNLVMKDDASSLFDVVLDENGIARPDKEDVN